MASGRALLFGGLLALAACSGSHMATPDAGMPDASSCPSEPAPSFQHCASLDLGSRFWPLSVEPVWTTTADVDGDGNIDVVGADFDGAIGVARGLGDGTFVASTMYPPIGVGRFTGLTFANLGGDALPELIVSLANANEIWVFPNTAGTFSSHVALTAGGDPSSIAAVDMTGDGVLDLVTANVGTSTVGVFINQGDGTFAPQVTYATAAAPMSLAAGDLNGDGKADIAIILGGVAGGLQVFINNGSGALASEGSYQAYGAGLAIANLDNDTVADIVVYGLQPTQLLKGLPSGGYAAPSSLDLPNNTSMLQLADLDGDGDIDILGGGTLLTNDGSATFTRLDGAPRGVLARIDSDTSLDVVSPGRGTPGFGVTLNRQGSLSRSLGTYPLPTYPSQPHVADIDGDGDDDVVLDTSDKLVVARNERSIFVPASYPKLDALALVRDLDGDNRPDYIFRPMSQLEIAMNTGDGTPGPQKTIPVDVAASYGDTRLTVTGDVNGDCRPDVVMAHGADPIQIVRNDGAPAFTALAPVPVDGNVVALAVGDLDANGNADLVYAVKEGAGDMVVVSLTRPAGFLTDTFTRVETLTFDLPSPLDIAIADIDGDHDLDVVVLGETMIALLAGHGDGTFDAPIRTALQHAEPISTVIPLRLQVVDRDGDGVAEIVALAPPVGAIVFSPDLATSTVYASPFGALGDFNGDGVPDVASVGGPHSYENYLYLYRGICAP